jgi:RHS repeat-associated protein
MGSIYAGSRHLVKIGGGTTFSHADWLGSERILTYNAGIICETITSLPFGDGITTTGGCWRRRPLYFTGKERDAESGLDNFGARYNTSSMGRFMSPDPSMDSVALRNPQTWNRYPYTLNNPLKFIDPSGECWVASPSGNGQFDWMNSPNIGQNCYDAVGTTSGNTLILYGSNDKNDITRIDGNNFGMVDLNEVNQQHDAAFDVDTRTQYSYVHLQMGADFFNFIQDYQSNYDDAPNLYVTEAGAENGTDVPGHLTHHGGKQIDLRYVDGNGNWIRDPEAYNQADADRMWDIFRMAHNAGITQIYAGNDSQWGDYAHQPTNPGADPHFSHFHLSIPNPVPPRH